ncbi:MAG: hypothetical protein ACI4V4_04725 [Eubacterium sp.]
MITVFTNADFISFNEENTTYSVMVINGKEIAYVGYNIPLCYDSERVIDLGGKAVIPLVNDRLCLTYRHADYRVLAEGEKADFAVLDKNILKDPEGVQVLEVYIHGKKKD